MTKRFSFTAISSWIKGWPWRELIQKLILPLILSVVGFFLSRSGTPEGLPYWSWFLLCVLLPFCFGYVLSDVLISYFNRRFLEDKIATPLQSIERRIDQLSLHYAFFTDHRYLEDMLEKSCTLGAQTRWLVPAFISKKLTHELEEPLKVKFQVTPKEFSGILTHLIPYCSASIYMTCPHTPSKWFDTLLRTSGKYEKARVSGGVTESDMPPHLQELLRLKGVVKKRLVLIKDVTELKDFFSHENLGFLHNFLAFSNSHHDIDTRFAYLPLMCQDCKKCSWPLKDIQIWDDDIVVEYENGDGDANGTCEMRFSSDRFHSTLFSTEAGGCFSHGSLITLAEMKKCLADLKKLRKAIQGTVEVPKWKTTIDKQTGTDSFTITCS